ncbi:uncharacterized protein LOC111623325 [Centruroides sculpturatus]|uniref:uncharacterized protein LOC111623325 n=1 Tax=Centruroides sculpturatus TaxID=218467 RepID=UPI000C6DD4C2|nr:uncharacterized protein LOC111623325 [Centruroides sculpturatus]
MYVKFSSIVYMILSLAFYCLGQDTDYDLSHKLEKEKVKETVDDKSTCIEKYYKCLLSSNFTKERYIEAAKECCVKTLNDSQSIWFFTFPYCINVLNSGDTLMCHVKVGVECSIKINSYFEEKFQYYLVFNEEVFNKIKPRPTSPDECDDSFIIMYGNSLKEQCENTSLANLGEECKILNLFI